MDGFYLYPEDTWGGAARQGHPTTPRSSGERWVSPSLCSSPDTQMALSQTKVTSRLTFSSTRWCLCLVILFGSVSAEMFFPERFCPFTGPPFLPPAFLSLPVTTTCSSCPHGMVLCTGKQGWGKGRGQPATLSWNIGQRLLPTGALSQGEGKGRGSPCALAPPPLWQPALSLAVLAPRRRVTLWLLACLAKT